MPLMLKQNGSQKPIGAIPEAGKYTHLPTQNSAFHAKDIHFVMQLLCAIQTPDFGRTTVSKKACSSCLAVVEFLFSAFRVSLELLLL